jgi:antitoxin MazE
MILDIVQIGNSQGIRIPKSILEECGINKKIDLEVKNNTITIKPVEIRKGRTVHRIKAAGIIK